MGTLAMLLKAEGHTVSGSDLKESDFTMRLQEQGADIFIGHHANNLGDCDVVVYSSAVALDNVEMQAAKAKNIPILKRAELLAQIMNPKKGITVAGAHGKTTTTSMLSCLLIQAGLKPTTAVGGIVLGGNYHANLGDGEYFVAEVDESDGSFLYFSPFYSVITNVDFEHVDYYYSWENILKAYRQFIGRTQDKGCLFIFGEDEKLLQLAKDSQKRFVTYGFLESNDIVAKNLKLKGYSLDFDCFYKGKELGKFHLKVPGRHNVLNALATIGVGMELKLSLPMIQQTLGEFCGAKRRLQLKGEINGVMVLDDYGHHPTEIEATLEAAKSFGRERIVVVFQPHRFSRTKFLMEEFAKSFKLCDYLILTDIYAASEKPLEGVTSQALFERIQAVKKERVVYLKKEDILPHLLSIVKKDDLVLTLGAGDVTCLSDELITKLNDGYAKILR